MEKKVLYFIASARMIKFYDDKEKYTIAKDVVIEAENGLVAKGDLVNVEISGDKVTKIVKVTSEVKKEEAPKAEVKVESPKVEEKVETAKAKDPTPEVAPEEGKKDDVVATLVVTKEVTCVSQYGLKFVGDDRWTNFSKELQVEDLKSKGVARKIVKATIEGGVIVKLEVVATPVEEKKEEVKSEVKEEKVAKKSSYRDEDSTDKRTALMTAKDIVVALINSKELDKSKVKDALKDLTKVSYEALQGLN
jgi:hypothetical protein